ncbi:2-polyprenyl-3-methyl-5-hydroxy-6-metoxy-1,4-benzoquinol methylase [Shewanella sairae]|uniref:2-polyprenyl-3-methyl-5-hydroxy-6-metoxy-1, 4-benzoquinol methylase n=1 Tax=Shewanella sairae TaxID=190310 RepID=A0ABQ4NYP6_9GAMM|nr:class I SAM-dependent methyltransferase [Shewanella sairae]MCL1131712.1 class I SAM-dependent methyltransferase [Shewanella sairae]GIU40092.1 2-polyprenyl-3-methyl-5-hydroxy-6-metoxy-1,4-benzoquinol methylase [Shewanella sairae]
MSICPLCQQPNLLAFYKDKLREYQRCSHCQLVSVPANYYLNATDEKAIYDKHQNNSDDLGYRKFLSRALGPILERVTQEAQGLDFGCGPGPTISVMAAEKGIRIENYDLYYCNEPNKLDNQYDFVICTEVIEHVADAKSLLETFARLLKPGGLLSIMTKRAGDLEAFRNWHYKGDPTHINFYSTATFEWIAGHFDWTLEVIGNDVVLFTRN